MATIYNPKLLGLSFITIVLLSIFILLSNTNCSSESGQHTCVSCHTSKEAIEADIIRRASDHQNEGEGPSCGGSLTRLKPTQAVYVSEDFVQDEHHNRFGCTYCHGGVEPANNRDDAHKDMVAVPDYNEYCRCHSEIVENMPISIHAKFNGLEPDDPQYVQRAAAHVRRVSDNGIAQSLMSEAIEKACADCHRVSCGSCHITLPGVIGGGFANTGHVFYETPSVVNNCTACHGGRKGNEFMAANLSPDLLEASDVGPLELSPDAHYQNGNGCIFCHDKEWMHGDNVDMTTRLRHENTKVPLCEDCHVKGDEDYFYMASEYHEAHADPQNSDVLLQCQVCHSQAYPNCISCHVKPTDTTEPPPDHKLYTLKIARNPFSLDYYRNINEDALFGRRPYDYTLVRRPSIVPDTFDAFHEDIPILANYTDYPTWKYAAPHNILMYTPQTEWGEKGCADACHVEDFATDPNAKWYLTESFLRWVFVEENFGEQASMFLQHELEANRPIIIGE